MILKILKNYFKIVGKKRVEMTWALKCAATFKVTLQFLVIYRLIKTYHIN